MSSLFAINHGCAVSVLGLSNTKLAGLGVWQSDVLYASYTLATLFGASYFVKQLTTSIQFTSNLMMMMMMAVTSKINR